MQICRWGKRYRAYHRLLPKLIFCCVSFIGGLRLQPDFVPVLFFFFYLNVGSVVKSAFMRYCDVVSWYVAIPGVIYQCASLSLFSWFEFKIKQAVTCAECVHQSHLTLGLFSSHTVPNAAPNQWKCDGFSYSTLWYSDVHTPTQIISYLYSAVHVWNLTKLWRADLWAVMMSTSDWQQKVPEKYLYL